MCYNNKKEGEYMEKIILMDYLPKEVMGDVYKELTVVEVVPLENEPNSFKIEYPLSINESLAERDYYLRNVGGGLYFNINEFPDLINEFPEHVQEFMLDENGIVKGSTTITK